MIKRHPNLGATLIKLTEKRQQNTENYINNIAII